VVDGRNCLSLIMEQKSKQKLLEYIAANATEAELLNLCLSVEDRIACEKSMTKDLNGFLQRVNPAKKVTVAVAATPLPSAAERLLTQKEQATRPEAAKRIRKEVATRILSHLKNGPDKLSTLANMLNMSTGKMSATVHTLAERGELAFDGKTVSLPKK
jgi:predicted transcriptional regulator